MKWREKLKVGWRHKLVPIFATKNGFLAIAAKTYAKAGIKVFRSGLKIRFCWIFFLQSIFSLTADRKVIQAIQGIFSHGDSLPENSPTVKPPSPQMSSSIKIVSVILQTNKSPRVGYMVGKVWEEKEITGMFLVRL